MDLKKLLNPEQYEAATTVEGQLLILAGAGSGKTRVLTYRIAHMLEDLQIKPYNILAITFTNKAAGEMRERVKALIGDEADRMWISTFHSTCVKILRREIEKLGYKKDFTIYDTSDQKTLIKEVIKSLNINDKDISDGEILSKISDCKDKLISPTMAMREWEQDFRMKRIGEAYILYQKKLKENNALDFDDLIVKTVELFKQHPDVLEFYQNKFKYVMIDEYQDTNKTQYEFVKMLAAKYKNICVVGDDDQCLVEDSIIEGESGSIKIQDVNAGDKIKVAVGNKETSLVEVTDVSKKEYNGEVIRVTTKSGKTITSTPYHMTFSKVKVLDNKYYVYLMYKHGYGYRIGQTSSVRSRNGELVSGLAARLNGEQADKMWIIKVCESREEATYYEELYSIKYGLPKVVFNCRGRGITLSQDQINNLFREIDTYAKADELMENEYLHNEYPHHLSSAVIRGETVRKRVNLSIFGGKKCNDRRMYTHRIGLNSSGDETKEKFIQAGFNVRDGQRNTYRVETERALYDSAEEFATKLCNVESGFEVLRKAKLTEDSFMFMPVGSLRVGMTLAIEENGEIEEDIIVSVERDNYSGFVYDLNIDSARNYIANGVVVHNCIYAWRGADIRNILDFEKDYPNTKIVKLERNYRSMGNILTAANSVIKNNVERKDKALRTEAENGEKIKIYRAYSDQDEGLFVANEIKKKIQEKNITYKDCAVLYRTNAQSRIFEDAFRKSTIPYRIVGGTKFYDRKEIKDILAYLKVLVNPQDSISLKRIINVPKRSIGDTTVEKVREFAESYEMSLYDSLLGAEAIPTLSARNISALAKFTTLMEELDELKEQLPISHLMETVLEKTGYIKELEKSNTIEDKSRIENLKELVTDAVEFEKSEEEDKSLSSYLEKVSLVQDVDNKDVDAESVVLMTVHSAKGLEFPLVFMVGMENGMFPGSAALNESPEAFKEMEEARRLCYVGITRAKETLYMTSAEMRRVFGRTVAYPPSDFLMEIPKELKEGVNVRTAVSKESRTPYAPGIGRPGQKQVYTSQYTRNNAKKTPAQAMNALESALNKKSSGEVLSKAEATTGRKVRHNKFGIGTIVSATPQGDDIKLMIAFDSQGVKTLLLSLSGLEAM